MSILWKVSQLVDLNSIYYTARLPHSNGDGECMEQYYWVWS